MSANRLSSARPQRLQLWGQLGPYQARPPWWPHLQEGTANPKFYISSCNCKGGRRRACTGVAGWSTLTCANTRPWTIACGTGPHALESCGVAVRRGRAVKCGHGACGQWPTQARPCTRIQFPHMRLEPLPLAPHPTWPHTPHPTSHCRDVATQPNLGQLQVVALKPEVPWRNLHVAQN